VIRKELVIILTKDVQETSNYIISNIPKDKINQIRNMYGQKSILVNDYRLTITNDVNFIARGHKPEISYVIGDIVTPKFGNVDFLTYISNISTRKEPVRKINTFEELDIKEFIDDRYAEEKYCASHKVKWFTTLHSAGFKDDVIEFEKEYESIFSNSKKGGE